MDNVFDKMYYAEGDLIGGIDEAGVSDMAGPLVAACVVLPKIDLHKDDLRIFEVNDSKQIPEKYRKTHAEVVWQVALGIGIGEVNPCEIDYLGQGAAIKLAMLRAIAGCRKTTSSKAALRPDFLLIDGKVPIQTSIRFKMLPEGDTKSLAIASASVIAKVYRDEIMIRYHEQYPFYEWKSNKGFPCEQQFKGIDEHGIQLGIHRIKSWPLVPRKRYMESPLWRERRQLWRSVTNQNLGQVLGDIWMPMDAGKVSSSASTESPSSVEPSQLISPP